LDLKRGPELSGQRVGGSKAVICFETTTAISVETFAERKKKEKRKRILLFPRLISVLL
jgi:hypothetical protein